MVLLHDTKRERRHYKELAHTCGSPPLPMIFIFYIAPHPWLEEPLLHCLQAPGDAQGNGLVDMK
jgi:hypothetical protein